IFKADGKGMEFSHRIEGIKSSSKDFELDSGQVWLLKDQLLYQLDLMDGLQGFQLKNKYISLEEGEAGIGTLKKIDNTLYFISYNQFYTYSMDRDRFEIDGPLTALFRGLPTISSIFQDSGGNLWYTYGDSASLGVFMKGGSGEYSLVTEPFSNLTGNFVSNYLSINTLDTNNIFIGLVGGL